MRHRPGICLNREAGASWPYTEPMRIEADGEDVLLWIKAVPGASRDQVAGTVGARLKVRTSAPPEGGKANKAICNVIAAALGRKPREVSIESGATNPEKIIRIARATVDDVHQRLAEVGA